MNVLKTLFVTFLLVIPLTLTACGNEKPNKLNWKVGEFSYLDQNAESFSLSDLKDKVWVADFIFTSCTTVCPPMTKNMSELQQKLNEQGVQAELVSFSVDPETDNPKVLKEYASKFSKDLSNWHLLTGYTQKEIEEFGTKWFKTTVKKPEGSHEVMHATTFFLVDKTGTIVSYYDGLNVPYEQIIKDIKALQ
jgi:protein SCO1/2